MTVLAEVEAEIAAALKRLQQAGRLPADLALNAVEVEPTRDPRHGDLATNAAMVLAKPARIKPRDIADALVAELAGLPGYALRLDAFAPLLGASGRPVDMLSTVTLLHEGRDLQRKIVKSNEPLIRGGLVVVPASFGRQPGVFAFS